MVSLRVNLKIAGQDNKLKNNSEEDNTNYDRDSETVSDLSITQDYSFLSVHREKVLYNLLQ